MTVEEQVADISQGIDKLRAENEALRKANTELREVVAAAHECLNESLQVLKETLPPTEHAGR